MTEKILSLAIVILMLTIWNGPVFFAGAEASESGPHDPEGGVSMRVLWTVSGYVFGKNPSWGEQEAKALLFKPLDIKEKEIVFNGQVCKGVTFQTEKVDAAEYLAGVWKVTPHALGLDEPKLQVIRTNCDIPGFQQYIRLSDRRLIVPINGVFFFFEPAVER